MKKHVFITGYYGFGNTGDEAILQAMISNLRSLQPDLRITVASARPDQTAAQHGTDAILWSNAHEILNTIRTADLVLIGGGGLFHDYWGIDPATVLTDNHSGIAFYTTSALLANLYSKPLMVYGVGVSELVSEHGKQFTKVTCDAANAVTVRDERSRDLLRSIGVAKDNIEVTADPAFAIPVCDKIQNKANLPGRSIGIALRNWNIGVHPDFWERELAAAIDQIVQNEAIEVELFPFQKFTGELEDDVAVSRRVRDRANSKAHITIVDENLSPCELLARIAQCDLILAMRLHGAIFGMIANVPVVALSYDVKLDDLMDRAGLADLCIDLKGLEADRLARRVSQVLADTADIRRRIQSCLPELRNSATHNAQIAVGLLRNEPKPVPLSAEATALLRRGIETQLATIRTSRSEGQRLLNEVDFYIRESQQNARRVDQLAAELIEMEAKIPQAEAAFRSQIDELQARIARLESEKRKLESWSYLKLREADDLRQNFIKAVERYNETFQQNLTTYRNQRAWQVMLAIRKAYTLLFRQGAGSFLKWVASWPFRGPGNLAPYDLHFPNAWNYMPDRIEAPLPIKPDYIVPEIAPQQRPEPRKLSELLVQQKYDLVILAVFNFEFRFQRPQQIATEFARRGHRVFWINPGRFLPPSHPKSYEAIELRQDLWEIHLRGNNPEVYTGSMDDADAANIAANLTAVYTDFTIAENCAVLQFPFWRRTGLALRDAFNARVLYDCMDDWQNWTAEPRISKWNLEEEKKLFREADVLVVTAREFYERQVANGLSPVLARNATDFAFFSSPGVKRLVTDKSKPVIGYFGAIADWFDLDLVTCVAKSRPQYNFLFIGHVYLPDIKKLASLPNVSMLGEKNYREIPLYLSDFDVCLIPFVLNDLIKGVDPVKMYEYFSQGKPVVITDMAEISQLADLLYVGKDADDFAAKIDEAVRENDPGRRQKRIEYAKANTWSARVDVIEPEIEKAFPKVSILVVTYNGEEFLEAFFDSVERNTAWPNYEILVVDNNSNERTRQILKAYAAGNERIQLQLLDRNAGFAAGNNIAARKATGEYLVFLNPDIIVPPGWLERMIRHCRRDPLIGAVAAMTNFSGNETKLNISYENVVDMQKFAVSLAKEKAGQATDIAVAALYCVLVPERVWRQVGELDEGFEVGMFEDDDFSLRIRNAGYRVVAAEDAFIHHFGNGSFGKIPSEQSLRIFEQNKKRYEAKWKTSWSPHKLRPGIRPPFEELRTPVRDFLRVSDTAAERRIFKLAIRNLHPVSCVAGSGFNVQPNGQSALGVDCDNATPGSVIVWGTTMLATWYDHPSFVSALVPPELCELPGSVEVYLMNDFGESNRMEFLIEPKTQ